MKDLNHPTVFWVCGHARFTFHNPYFQIVIEWNPPHVHFVHLMLTILYNARAFIRLYSDSTVKWPLKSSLIGLLMTAARGTKKTSPFEPKFTDKQYEIWNKGFLWILTLSHQFKYRQTREHISLCPKLHETQILHYDLSRRLDPKEVASTQTLPMHI